jgi:hypothetical protein
MELSSIQPDAEPLMFTNHHASADDVNKDEISHTQIEEHRKQRF